MGNVRLVRAAASLAALGLAGANAASGGSFLLRATVTSVAAGDTIGVRLADGTILSARLLGVESPPAGACWSAESTAAARLLAAGKRVWLVGDARQPSHAANGDLLAYVVLPGGRDLGLELVRRGDARVVEGRRPFQQAGAYRGAERRAAADDAGLWSCAAAPRPAPKAPHGGHGNGPPASAAGLTGGPAQVPAGRAHGHG